MDPLTHDLEWFLGPEQKEPPPPKICVKCGEVSVCEMWEQFPQSMMRSGDGRSPVWNCPFHGYFECFFGPFVDGLERQSFDVPDVYVTGPNGERMFER